MDNGKAFIDQILLWFLILVLTIGFVATVSDEKDLRVKYHNLKAMTDHAVIAAAKYYTDLNVSWNNGEDERDESENVADYVVRHDTSNLANDVPLVFSWPVTATHRYVEASVTHTHDNFWWRFFGFKEADLVVSSRMLLETIEAPDVAPIGVNGCSRKFEAGDTFSLDLTAHDIYDKDDNIHFYALSDKNQDPDFDCSEGDGNAQAAFTQFKQIIDDIVKDKLSDETTFNIEEDYKPVANVCEHELTDSNSLANDLKQSESSFGSSFPIKMSIIVLGCQSTDGNNLEYKEIIPIEVTGIDFVKKDHFTISFRKNFTGII